MTDIFVELFEDSDFSGQRDLKGDDENVDIDQNEEIPAIMREIPMEQP